MRESRRVLTRKELSDYFARSGTQDPAMVAAGAWPAEYHPGAGKPSQWEMHALQAELQRQDARLPL